MFKSSELIKLFLAISISLFFLQGLQTVFSSLFGIIYDQVFVGPVTIWLGTSSLLLIAALIAPSFVPDKFERGLLPVMVAAGVIARLAMTMPRPDVRYWSALVVIFTGAFFLRMYLERVPREAVIALLGALIVGQLLRNLGATYDLSLRPSWLAIQIAWSLLLIAALLINGLELPVEARSPTWLVGLALGGFLFLELSLLSLPNGLARWSGWSYTVLVPALLTVTIVPLLPPVWEGVQIWAGTNWGPRVLIVLLLMGGLAYGYFREGPSAGLLLVLTQGALLAAMVAIFALERPEGHGALWFPLGLVFFLLLNYFNAFAFTYPYTLPLMRGLGWVVYLFAAAGVALALLAASQSVELTRAPAPSLALLGGVALLVSTVAAFPREPEAPSSEGALSFATYNVHYGYDEAWNYTLDEMADVIRESRADFVALQEVDTGRLTSYSVDNALYLASRLGMNAAYLATVEHLTGIAVLYRGPEAPVTSKLLTSDLEQTGIIGVSLYLGDQKVGAYGIWVGLELEEAERQVDEALEFISDEPFAVFAGDFNLEHGDAPIDQIQGEGFIDPFVSLGVHPPPPTHPAVDPQRQIDFVWLRGLAPTDAALSDSMASDHRLVITTAEALP